MRRTLSLICGLSLGVALSQFPEYAQQYTQRLGGAVDELRRFTTEFDAAATQAGLSREQALARYTNTSDSFVNTRGESMRITFARYATLEATLQRVRTADPLQRLTNLPEYLDSEIGGRTLEAFKPAVPVTFEGLAYAVIGLLGGYLLTSGIYKAIVYPFRWRRRHRRHRYRDEDAEIA